MVRQDAALPGRIKIAVLAQEVIRRERNMAVDVVQSRREYIRNDCLVKLLESGYSTKQRIKWPERVQINQRRRKQRWETY